jgi:N4-gp56 family major capsid protein
MAQSTIQSANVVTKFQKKVRKQYVRGDEVFGPFIGDTSESIIQTNKDLKKHSIPLVGALSGSGVRGSTQLVGSEEALSNYAMTFTPTHVRNGVLIDNEENEKAEFDLFMEAEPTLTNWMKEVKRDQMIQALGAIEAGGTYYNYGGTEASGAKGSSAASAANMDTWVTNNTDRILYGSAESNLTSGDHTTSLATIDTTNDKVTPSVLSHLKRMAQKASPLIRPVRIDGTEPFFVYMCGSYAFRDIRENSTIQQANREARQRGESNPLFTGGNLMWDNILIVENPDLDKFIDNTSGTGLWDGVWGANATGDSLLTGGASSSRVGMGFLLGAQALTFGRGKDAEFKRRKEDDYEHLNGVAIVAKHDIKKNFYNNKQHGMVTHFHSAAADA